jgi:hypothetical protein
MNRWQKHCKKGGGIDMELEDHGFDEQLLETDDDGSE